MSQYPNEPADPYAGERSRGWGAWAAIAVIVALFVVIGVFLFMTAQAPADPIEEVGVADVADDAAIASGDSVDVAAEVEELLTEQAMTIRDDEGGEPLLVLVPPTALVNGMGPGTGAAPAGQFLPSEGFVQVLGTVESFDRAAMADELGIVLNEELFASREGQPVIVADQIETFADPADGAADEAAASPEGEG